LLQFDQVLIEQRVELDPGAQEIAREVAANVVLGNQGQAAQILQGEGLAVQRQQLGRPLIKGHLAQPARQHFAHPVRRGGFGHQLYGRQHVCILSLIFTPRANPTSPEASPEPAARQPGRARGACFFADLD